jgi:hypothetical protein
MFKNFFSEQDDKREQGNKKYTIKDKGKLS